MVCLVGDSLVGQLNVPLLGKSPNTLIRRLKAPKIQDIEQYKSELKDSKLIIRHTGINNIRNKEETDACTNSLVSAVTSLKEEAPNAKIVISRLLPVDGRKRHITDRRIDGTRYLDCENVRKNGGTRHVNCNEVRRDARIRRMDNDNVRQNGGTRHMDVRYNGRIRHNVQRNDGERHMDDSIVRHSGGTRHMHIRQNDRFRHRDCNETRHIEVRHRGRTMHMVQGQKGDKAHAILQCRTIWQIAEQGA